MLIFFFFFFNAPATTEIYTLSLHDALPIWLPLRMNEANGRLAAHRLHPGVKQIIHALLERSEEHTSELQSRRDLVCRLLLEKKKKDLTCSSWISSTIDIPARIPWP